MDVVNICGASKTYSGKRAVDDLRMTVPQGAIYGFVGRNGAGGWPNPNRLDNTGGWPD